MLKFGIPLIRVKSSIAAEQFYCGKLGFQKYSATRANEKEEDPCYLALTRDNVWIHVSSFPGDGVFGSAVNILVEDVDKLYEEFVGNGIRIDLVPTDQTWGNREMYVKDADGNCIRFFQESRT